MIVEYGPPPQAPKPGGVWFTTQMVSPPGLNYQRLGHFMFSSSSLLLSNCIELWENMHHNI